MLFLALVLAFADEPVPAPTPQATPAPAVVDPWTIRESVDPMTDERRLMFSSRGSEIVGSVEPVEPLFVLSCGVKGQGPAVGLATMTIVEGGSPVPVTLRVDGGEAFETRGAHPRVAGGNILLDPEQVLPRLVGGRKLLAKWPVYRAGSPVSTFDITGIDAKLARLRAECPK